MINSSTKKILLILFTSCSTFIAKGQLGFNYSQYDAGVSLGLNQVYGDASSSPITPSVNLNFTYNQTPYVNFVFSGEFGKLKGGSAESLSGRQFENTFSAFNLRGQLQAGEFFDYSHSQVANALKNFYLSAGIGYIVDQITFINRVNSTIRINTNGLNDANEIYIPLRVGYEFKVFNQYNMPNLKVDLAYQFNSILGDNLDGYAAGHGNDILSQFCIGVKLAIGPTTSYRKQIEY